MHSYSSRNAAAILKAQEIAGVRLPELAEGLTKQMAGNPEKMSIQDIAKIVQSSAKFNNYDEKLFNKYLQCAQTKFSYDQKYSAISSICYACYLTQHFNPEFFDSVVDFMIQTKSRIYNINHYDASQLLGAFAQFDIAQPDIMFQLQSVMVDKTDNRDCDKLMTAMFSFVLLQQPAWMCREICDHFMIQLADEYKVVRRKIRRELPKDWYLKIYLCHVICEVYNRPIPINDKLVEVSKKAWKFNIESQVQSKDSFKGDVVEHLNMINIKNQANFVLPKWLLLIDIVIDEKKRVCVQLIRPGSLAANNPLVELHPSVMSRKLLEQLGWKVVPINQVLWDQCKQYQEQKLDQLEKYQIMDYAN